MNKNEKQNNILTVRQEKVWKRCIGNKKQGYDAFNRKVIRDHCGRKDVPTGWDVDHTWPISQQGSKKSENLQVLSVISNREKANRLQGSINGITFAIKKYISEHNETKGRMQIKKERDWYWAYDDWE